MPDLMYSPTQYDKRPNIQPVSEGGGIFSFGDTVRGIGAGAEGFGRSIIGLADWATGDNLIDDKYSQERFIDRPTTLVGGLAEGITQFAIGFYAAGLGWAGKAGAAAKALEAGKLSKTAYGALQAVRGAAVDFAAFDGHDGRLSNLLQSFPELKNPVLDYLAANPDDTQGEGRAKNVLEGALTELGLKGIGKVFGKALTAFKRGTKAVGQVGDLDFQTDLAARKFREAAYGERGLNMQDDVLETYAESVGIKPEEAGGLETVFERYDAALGETVKELRTTYVAADSKIPVVRELQEMRRGAAKSAKQLTDAEVIDLAKQGLVAPVPAGDIEAVESFIKAVGPDLFDNLSLLRPFPGVFSDGLRSGNDVRGAYEHKWRVVQLGVAAVKSGTIGHTTLHELWHSLEQMLPSEDVVKIHRQYMDERAAFLASDAPGAAALRENRVPTSKDFPSELDADGTLSAFDRYYSLTTPSEWFAVNLTNRTLAAKHADDPAFSLGRSWLGAVAQAFTVKYGGEATQELFDKFLSGKFRGGKAKQSDTLRGLLGAGDGKARLNSESLGPRDVRAELGKRLDELEAIKAKVESISDGEPGSAGAVMRNSQAMNNVIEGYGGIVDPLNLEVTHRTANDVSVELTRLAEQMNAPQSAADLKGTRRVMNDTDAAAARATAEWLAVATDTKSVNGLFAAFEGLAKESHVAGMKFFDTLHLSRAVLVKQSKRVAQVLQEVKPLIDAGTASDKQIATTLRMIEAFATTVQGVRKTMYIAGKTLQSAQRGVNPEALAKARKAAKAVEAVPVKPVGAVPAAATGELPLAGEAAVGKVDNGLTAPEVPQGELPLAGEAAAGKVNDGLTADAKPTQGDLPLEGAAASGKVDDGLTAPGTAEGELPFTRAASQEDQGIIETFANGGPKDPRFAKAKAAASGAQTKLDELADELGLDDDGVKSIITRFGGRKKALRIFDAVGRFKDDPDGLQRMLNYVDKDNKNLLTEAGFDMAKFAKLAEKEAGRRTISDAWVEWYMNSLLSGPKTLVTNAFSGAVTTLWRPLELFMGGDKHRLRLPLLYMTGMIDSFGDAMRFAKQAFKDEAPVLLRDAENAIEGSRTAAISAAGQGLNAASAGGRAIDFIGRLIRLPSATLTATDEFWKQLAYRSEAKVSAFRKTIEDGGTVAAAKANADAVVEKLVDSTGRAPTYARAYSEARAELLLLPEAQGLDPADLHIFTKEKALETLKVQRESGLERINTDAQSWAMEATLTTPLDDSTLLGAFGRKLQDLNSSFPVLRLFLPFIRTPLNILSFAAHRMDAIGTVVAPINSALKRFGRELPESSRFMTRFSRDIAEGGAKRNDAIGRLTFGLSAAVTIGMYASQGMITGTGPKDPHQRAALLATGWQPYSIKFGDTYYSYARLDPLATSIGVLADIVDVTGRMEDDPTASEYLSGAMSGILAGFTNNMTERSYLVGLATLLDAVQDPEGRAVSALQRIGAGAVVPSFFNQTLNAGDPHMREMRGFVDELRNRVGADLPEKRDALGAPVRRRKAVGDSTFTNAVVPIEASEERGDPVRSEMARLKHGFRAPKTEYGGVDLLGIKHNGEGTAYAAWQEKTSQVRVGGKTLEAALGKLIGSSDYKKLPDSVDGSAGLDSPKTAAINSVIGRYRREAFAKLLKENSELRKAYTGVQSARKKLR